MASPNIFAQYAQPVRSFTDYTQQLEQLNNQRLMGDNLAQQNAIRAAAMQDAERQRMAQERENNALAALTAQAGGDESRYTDLLRKGGYYGQAQKLEEGRAKIGKETTDAQAKALETKRKAFEYVIQGLQIAQSPQEALQMVNDSVTQGAMSMQQAQRFAAGIPQNAAEFPKWQLKTLRSIMNAKDQLPTVQTRNLGGTTDTLLTDVFDGTSRVVNSVPNTQSPDNRASVAASMANASAVRETANATRDAARITARAGDETKLRQEFADLPEVKKYKNAIPAYQAIVKAAETNNPQADINLIYGLAKLYDPDSVVREGEYDTIANSQSIPEWLKGQAQRLAGGGKLTADTKKQIKEQAAIRINAYKGEYDGARKSYEEIATGRGLETKNIFPAVGAQIGEPGKVINFSDLK